MINYRNGEFTPNWYWKTTKPRTTWFWKEKQTTVLSKMAQDNSGCIYVITRKHPGSRFQKDTENLSFHVQSFNARINPSVCFIISRKYLTTWKISILKKAKTFEHWSITEMGNLHLTEKQQNLILKKKQTKMAQDNSGCIYVITRKHPGSRFQKDRELVIPCTIS